MSRAKKPEQEKDLIQEMEKTVQETAPVEKSISSEKQKEEEPFDLNKSLAIGYIAGVKKDGNFMFELFGYDKTLTSLLGVHNIATQRIEAEKQKNMVSGDALVVQIGNLVVQLNQKMDRLIGLLEKPQNKL